MSLGLAIEGFRCTLIIFGRVEGFSLIESIGGKGRRQTNKLPGKRQNKYTSGKMLKQWTFDS
jgi:hypothetical protein